MNLLKAKRQVEEQDVSEFRAKKEKYLERKKQKKELREAARDATGPADSSEQVDHSLELEGAELDSYVRYAMYIGSFTVLGTDPETRAEFVRRQLMHMQDAIRTKPVLLVISLAGIKVCDRKGQSVMMAHTLRRISYATCDPEARQFAFLAREPKGQVNVQHCYAFLTQESAQAEELNSIIGNVFNMAGEKQQEYASRYSDDIEDQLEQQRRQFLQVQQRAREDAEMSLRANTNNNSSAKGPLEETQKEIEAGCLDSSKSDYITHLPPVPCASQLSPCAAVITSPLCHPSSSSSSQQPGDASSYMDLSSKSSSAGSSDRDSEIYALNSTAGGGPSSLYYDSRGADALSSYDSGAFGRELYSEQRTGNYSTARGAALAARLAGVNVENYMDPVSSHDRQSVSEDAQSISTDSGSYFGLCKKESMRYRPLPISPAGSSVQPPCTPGLPPRYQNDSPFVYNSKRSSQLSLSSQSDSSSSAYTSRSNSLQDDMLTSDAWYRPNLPREQALEILQSQELGSFLVRDSATHPGCFALSVKVPKFDNPTGIAHYIITRTKTGGVKMKGLPKEWPNLDALVVHHSIMQELLPCTLHIAKSSRRSSAANIGAPPAGYAPPPPTSSGGVAGSVGAATKVMQRSKSSNGMAGPVTLREKPMYRRYCSTLVPEETLHH